MSYFFSKIIQVILIVCLLQSGLIKAVFAEDISQEYQLKAAYLFNFARFTSWPENAISATSSINFCIIGVNPFGNILSNLEEKQIESQSISIYYLNTSSAEQICHLAFYSNADSTGLADLDWRFSGPSTLNVSDIPGFIEAGGDIEVLRKQNRLVFQISNTNMKKKKLQPRASLLELADAIF